MSKWLQSMTQSLAGFPNFPVDTVLTDIVIRLAKNNVHQYLPMAGYPPLLSNIALLVKNPTEEFFARNRNTSNCRATQAIFTTIQALVKANDVIILDPSYDCYEALYFYAMQFQCAFH
jgi:methionine aminotransferase